MIDEKVRTIVRFQWFIAVAIVFIILVPTLLGFYLNRNFSQVYQVRISDETILGPTELCPGDTLRYRYHISTGGVGVLNRDQTLWRVTPPRTLEGSEPMRLIVPYPLEQDIVESYEIPETYFDRDSLQEKPLPPGDYIRVVSVSSPSRSTVFTSTDKFKFKIKEASQC